MVAAGIVTTSITDDEKYSLPHEKTQIKNWGHIATVIPILSEIIPKLDEATTLDGPKGIVFNIRKYKTEKEATQPTFLIHTL